MSDATAVMRELHRIHRQLSDLRERLDRGPRQIKAREAGVAHCQAELDNIRGEAKAAKVHVDQKQLTLKSSETKIGELRVKLNQAASNREYQALQDQIAADEMANSVLADEILEALERIDAYAGRLAEAEKAVAKAKEELAKTQGQVRDQEGLLKADVQRLEGELREVEQRLPDDLREVYQRVTKSKGTDAMAAVEGDNCGGCYQSLTPNMFNSLTLGRVVLCQSCGRLLYLAEDRTPGKKS